jgi:hypothetical protein
MDKTDSIKNYAESFAIFAKYKCREGLDLDYQLIQISLDEEVSPEDNARLLELGWKFSNGAYWKSER